MNDSESFGKATAAALRFLSYRPRSEAEIRARLLRRFPVHVVEPVLQSLVQNSLVDDSAFAKLWRDSRDSLNPKSASVIKGELVSKGVARDVAEAAVGDLDDRDSAYCAALRPARRLIDADFATFRRKLWGYLLRRGFSSSLARDTIARLWDERGGTHSLQPDEAES